jgi:hypothetical protein
MTNLSYMSQIIMMYARNAMKVAIYYAVIFAIWYTFMTLDGNPNVESIWLSHLTM